MRGSSGCSAVKSCSHFAILLTLLAAGLATARQNPRASDDVSGAAAPPTTHQMSKQEAALIRGDIQMARKDYDQAVAEYRLALEGDQRDALLLNKIGIAYQQLGDLNQA